MSAHNCPIPGCLKVVPSSDILMCLKHWRKVPEEIRKRVWRTWRRGPPEQYLEARKAAIDAASASDKQPQLL